MVRIGIVGSDNSHAIAFSKLFNLSPPGSEVAPEDFRVVALYGTDAARNQEVAEAGAIETIVDKPEDMLGMVDAVMVVWRHGDLHAQYALPFINAGIPTWVDKPFAIKVEDAKAMIEAAERRNTPLSGGSTLKHSLDMMAFRARLSAEGGRSIKPIVAGTINYYAALENEYGGIYFYGSHLAEMTMAIFGYDARSVTAVEHKGNVAAVVKYDDYHVVMNFLEKAKSIPYVLVFGENGTLVHELDGTTGYQMGVANFVKMVQNKRAPFPLDHLLQPVALLQAVDVSMREKREVALSELV
ncbi:MAG: Gfo/Idh/MocA family oxidoreductase [Anaerolineae bacterium]|nr:Gfo/Idh/MocA family oxidoreductase [Anaerolineae bacterium]